MDHARQGRRPRRVRRRATTRPVAATSSAGTAWDLTSTRRVGAASSTSSSSTRRDSSRSRRRSPARWPGRGCSCSATPSSCHRCRRARTPTRSTPRRSAGSSATSRSCRHDLGYFLETTWRMHPALTAPVSRLSYAGQLRSEESVTGAPHARRRRSRPARAARRPPRQLDVVARGGRGRPATSCATSSVAGGTTRPSAARTVSRSGPGRSPRPTSSSSRRTTARSGSCAAPSTTPASPTSRSARSTSSRARRRPSRSCRWPRRRTRTCRAAWASCSTGTASTSRCRAASTRRSSCAPTVLTDFAPRTPGELIALGAFLGLCDSAVSSFSVNEPTGVPV